MSGATSSCGHWHVKTDKDQPANCHHRGDRESSCHRILLAIRRGATVTCQNNTGRVMIPFRRALPGLNNGSGQNRRCQCLDSREISSLEFHRATRNRSTTCRHNSSPWSLREGVPVAFEFIPLRQIPHNSFRRRSPSTSGKSMIFYVNVASERSGGRIPSAKVVGSVSTTCDISLQMLDFQNNSHLISFHLKEVFFSLLHIWKSRQS